MPTNHYSYYVIQDRYPNGNMFAYVIRLDNGRNLVHEFAKLKYACTINACHSCKEAKDTAEFWNKCHKINGDYGLEYDMTEDI